MSGDASDGTRQSHLTRVTSALDELTRSLLCEADIDDSLGLAADLLRAVADGDASLLFLPSFNGRLACEITSGTGVAHLLGMPFDTPLDPAVGYQVHQDASSSFLATEVDLSAFGPLGVVTFAEGDAVIGAVAVLRKSGRPPFEEAELEAVQDCTSQVSLVLKLAEADDAEERAAILEERERISRDLHDYAIQEIFGVGIVLDRLRGQAVESGSHTMAEGIEEGMRSLEEAILQIRRVVYTLHEPPADQPFTTHLEEESSRARRILGFAPSLVFDLDGFPILPGLESSERMFADLNSRVDQSTASDAAATVREALSNVARHANARSVMVNVALSGRGIIGELVLTIVDDGTGLDKENSQNSGLDNMSRRAALHGGSFAAGAGPRGRGTSLVWRVPLT